MFSLLSECTHAGTSTYTCIRHAYYLHLNFAQNVCAAHVSHYVCIEQDMVIPGGSLLNTLALHGFASLK